MAQMPIEIVEVGDIPREAVGRAMAEANSVQAEFLYSRLPEHDAEQFGMHAYRRTQSTAFMDGMEEIRARLRGYHPYLMAIIDAELDGDDLLNIFGSNRAKAGVGVITTSRVPDVILPSDRMAAYFVYYFARYTLSYIVPNHKNHDETRDCIYDRKINKLDILKSMRERSFCDECRGSLLRGDTRLSARQFSALDKLFELSGRILNENPGNPGGTRAPRAFIGSSSEGLRIANTLQMLLERDLEAEVWNQGSVFGLGTATLEALEAAAQDYQFGIFVFSPDDMLQSRGETRPVARDNVIFELGLFVGKLSRRRVFVVNPSRNAVSLPSDLAGITTATYDPEHPRLAAALGPACQRIREAVAQSRSTT